MDKEQTRRERAYKIWEDEGRPEGKHEDHWRQAEDQHEAAAKEAADVTQANERASQEFNDGGRNSGSPVDRPPSTAAPD